jgi:hypothetical protein
VISLDDGVPQIAALITEAQRVIAEMNRVPQPCECAPCSGA